MKKYTYSINSRLQWWERTRAPRLNILRHYQYNLIFMLDTGGPSIGLLVVAICAQLCANQTIFLYLEARVSVCSRTRDERSHKWAATIGVAPKTMLSDRHNSPNGKIPDNGRSVWEATRFWQRCMNYTLSLLDKNMCLVINYARAHTHINAQQLSIVAEMPLMNFAAMMDGIWRDRAGR